METHRLVDDFEKEPLIIYEVYFVIKSGSDIGNLKCINIGFKKQVPNIEMWAEHLARLRLTELGLGNDFPLWEIKKIKG